MLFLLSDQEWTFILNILTYKYPPVSPVFDVYYVFTDIKNQSNFKGHLCSKYIFIITH